MNDNRKQQEIIDYAFRELQKAFSSAQKGKSPMDSYHKLKSVVDNLSVAEKKLAKEEISEEEMDKAMEAEIEKLKEV